jgi:outer membrane lipoprotein LolB
LPWSEWRAARQAEDSFALAGRVAVAHCGQGFNAALRWEQDGARTVLALDGPLGVGGARVETDGATLTVATSRGEALEGDAARAELERRIGFALPLASLRYWVRGVPAPGVPATEQVDEATQRLLRLEQSGWVVDYGTPVAGALPRRLVARRDATQVRVVIDRWDP